MQLKIYHGDNQSLLLQSAKRLTDLFDAQSVSRFSLRGQSFEQLMLALSTPSFFAEKRIVVIEDADEKKIDVMKLPKDDDLTIVIIFGKELASSSVLLSDAKKRQAEIFSLSVPQDKQIFQFLDLLFDRNAKALTFVDGLYRSYGGQYLLTMIIFQLRRLLLPSSAAPGFIVKKIEVQQKLFGHTRLQSLYYETLQTEFAIKTGKVDEQTGVLLLISRILTG